MRERSRPLYRQVERKSSRLTTHRSPMHQRTLIVTTDAAGEGRMSHQRPNSLVLNLTLGVTAAGKPLVLFNI